MDRRGGVELSEQSLRGLGIVGGSTAWMASVVKYTVEIMDDRIKV